jgi:hypothetical protein
MGRIKEAMRSSLLHIARDFAIPSFILTILLSCYFPHLLLAVGERLQFSDETEEYFKDELSLPSPPGQAEGFYEGFTEKVGITSSVEEEGRWVLTFVFPKPVHFTQEIQGNAIDLQFNQGVDSEDFIKVQEKLGSGIKRLASGYNTLEIVARRAVHYHTESSGRVFVLEIIFDETAPVEQTRALEIAEARLAVEERYFRTSECLLSQLRQKYPDNKDLLLLQAGLEGVLPRWQKSYRLLKELASQYPDDADIRTYLNQTYSPHSSYVLVERQLQKTVGLARVYPNRFQAEGIVHTTPSSMLYLGAQYQLWHGNVVGIVNSQGVTVPFRGDRNQGTLYMRNEWDSALRIGGSVYGQDGGVLGVGGESGFYWPLIQGDIAFLANWHRPCWEVFEALAFHGREDAVRMALNSTANRYISLSVGGGARRIGITGTRNGYISGLAAANVFFFVRITNPQFAFNYSLDAEYVIYEKKKKGVVAAPITPTPAVVVSPPPLAESTSELDPTSDVESLPPPPPPLPPPPPPPLPPSVISFNPVPYTSFENHSLRGFLYYRYRERWYLTLFGGGTINRLSGLSAPTYGINLKYSKPCPWGCDFELSAYRFPSTVVSGSTAYYYTGSLTARF